MGDMADWTTDNGIAAMASGDDDGDEDGDEDEDETIARLEAEVAEWRRTAEHLEHKRLVLSDEVAELREVQIAFNRLRSAVQAMKERDEAMVVGILRERGLIPPEQRPD